MTRLSCERFENHSVLLWFFCLRRFDTYQEDSHIVQCHLPEPIAVHPLWQWWHRQTIRKLKTTGPQSTVFQRLGAGGNIGFRTAAQFGKGQGVIAIANATVAPSVSPAGDGILYVENGALKYKGSNGTVTAIAPA